MLKTFGHGIHFNLRLFQILPDEVCEHACGEKHESRSSTYLRRCCTAAIGDSHGSLVPLALAECTTAQTQPRLACILSPC